MATIKSFTSLEQSKKLAEILPLESADMCYLKREFNDTYIETPILKPKGGVQKSLNCWSLASLLGVLPKGTRLLKSATDDIYYHCDCPKGNVDKWFDNPVDACVAMIERLHELNL